MRCVESHLAPRSLWKAANLDRDESGWWRGRRAARLPAPRPLIALSRRRGGTHPASFRLISPSASPSVSLIRPPGLYFIHFYTALRLLPRLLSLPVFPPPAPAPPTLAPRMMEEKKTTLMFSPAVLFVAYRGENRSKVRSDRRKAFEPD